MRINGRPLRKIALLVAAVSALVGLPLTSARAVEGGWVICDPGLDASLRGVAVADSQHAWICGYSLTSPRSGIILGTRDGGRSWNQQYTAPQRFYLSSIACVNAQQAWAMGDARLIGELGPNAEAGGSTRP